MLLVAACGDDGPMPAASYGAELFRDPAFSDSRFNVFSCATCHTSNGDDRGKLAGGSLYNTAFRAAWWGGYAPRLIDAVSFCHVYFMRGVPLDPFDTRARALYEYLVSISPDRGLPPRASTVIENVATLARGDPERGRAAYDAACRDCHGAPHSGNGRLDGSVAIIPEASIGFGRQYGFEPALIVIEKVRHGQFFGVGGNMPLFTREALSDEDLGAIVAYLRL